MSWLKRFLQSGASAKPSALETSPSGASDNLDMIAIGLDTTAAPDNRNRALSDETKRRQVAMTLRYVLLVRAR